MGVVAGAVGRTVTESWFRRRPGLLTVTATTAAGRGRYDVVDAARGEALETAARAVPGLPAPFLGTEALEAGEPRGSPAIPHPGPCAGRGALARLTCLLRT